MTYDLSLCTSLRFQHSTAHTSRAVPTFGTANAKKNIRVWEWQWQSVSKWHRLSLYLFCVMVYGYACFIIVQTAWNNRWLVDWQWVTVAWLASGQVSDGRTCSNIAHRTRSDPNQNDIPNWPQPTITNPKAKHGVTYKCNTRDSGGAPVRRKLQSQKRTQFSIHTT